MVTTQSIKLLGNSNLIYYLKLAIPPRSDLVISHRYPNPVSITPACSSAALLVRSGVHDTAAWDSPPCLQLGRAPSDSRDSHNSRRMPTYSREMVSLICCRNCQRSDQRSCQGLPAGVPPPSSPYRHLNRAQSQSSNQHPTSSLRGHGGPRAARRGSGDCCRYFC